MSATWTMNLWIKYGTFFLQRYVKGWTICALSDGILIFIALKTWKFAKKSYRKVPTGCISEHFAMCLGSLTSEIQLDNSNSNHPLSLGCRGNDWVLQPLPSVTFIDSPKAPWKQVGTNSVQMNSGLQTITVHQLEATEKGGWIGSDYITCTSL